MEQNVLITKMIGIVVAVIVAAVVLVPICNSLTEGDGGSGGGGETGYEMVNDLSDFLKNGVGLTIPDKYNSYMDFWSTSDSEEDVPEYILEMLSWYSDFSWDLNDLIEFEREIQSMSFDSDKITQNVELNDALMSIGFNLLYVVDFEYNDVLKGGVYANKDEMGVWSYEKGLDIGMDEWWEMYQYDEESGELISGPSIQENVDEFSLTFDVDALSGHIYIKFHNDNGEFFEMDRDILNLSIISENDVGFISSSMWDAVPASDYSSRDVWQVEKWADIEIKEGMIADIRFIIIWESHNDVEGWVGGATVPDIQNGVWSMGSVELPDSNPSTIEGDAVADLSIPIEDNRIMFCTSDLIVDNLTMKDGREPQEIDSAFTYISSISTVAFTDSADSGSTSSSSDSGSDLGTTGTILSVIPIFVALGLIIGIVGMFYQNRNGL